MRRARRPTSRAPSGWPTSTTTWPRPLPTARCGICPRWPGGAAISRRPWSRAPPRGAFAEMATLAEHRAQIATVQARRAAGRAVRREVPRSVHGEWAPPPGPRDPVATLEEQGASRVAELVPIRYGRMLVSPFAFFRGGAAIMASDLAAAPRTGLEAQLCGDAHLANFGVFYAPDRRLIFSVNDFDETLPGPFEWDLKRLTASFAVAARAGGIAPRRRARIIGAVSATYRTAMRGFAAMGTLELWHSRIEVEELERRMAATASARQERAFRGIVDKARGKDSLRALDKLCDTSGDVPRIVSDPPAIVPVDDLVPGDVHRAIDGWAERILHGYAETLTGDRRRLLARFHYVHAARKIVGVGSVGTRCWIALLVGRDERDPLFLQFKEAEPSVLEPYLGTSAFAGHGERVVEGQRLMQAAPDILLGWDRLTGVDGVERDFYVRQLWDGKGGADVAAMDDRGL